jgi:sn-glycerol 3-phosphate transport system substrate-binding protein
MKHLRKFRIALAVIATMVLPALAVAEPITVNWWHAHGGVLGEKVNAICEGFNKSQNQYQVVPTYKGSYADTMTAGIAAFRAKNPPHILQVFEVGTATMMAAKGAIKPVYEVMKESGLPFDPNAYLPTVIGYYTTTDGRMLSMPFNSSTPILYYNIDAFKKAGLDPAKPPTTWPEVAAAARCVAAVRRATERSIAAPRPAAQHAPVARRRPRRVRGRAFLVLAVPVRSEPAVAVLLQRETHGAPL